MVGLALKCREYRHRPLDVSQILLPIPPSPYGQPSPRSGGRRVPKQRWVVARGETAGGMANKICGTSARQEHERFGLVGKSRPCGGYAPAAAPTPAPTLVGGQILVPTPPSGSQTPSPRPSGLCTRKFLRMVARSEAAGGVANRICGNKARAGGGQPGHLGNETLTQGISHAPRPENLATRSLHRIFNWSGYFKRLYRQGTQHTPGRYRQY